MFSDFVYSRNRFCKTKKAKTSHLYLKFNNGKNKIQKKIIDIIGFTYLDPDSRVLKRNNYLISQKRIDKLGKILEPGDIVLERRGWRSSNLGIAGFWKHTILYLGDLKKLDKYFEKESEKLFGCKVSGYLKKNFCDAYFECLRNENKDNFLTTIESVREGVSILNLKRADYLSALRPRVSKMKKLQAIVFALKHFGKPYDHVFDMSSDDMFVCSELIGKAYLPSKKGAEGLDFELKKVAGRWIFYANSIVQDFEKKYKTKDQQFDFVIFYNGKRKSSVKKFLQSWKV